MCHLGTPTGVYRPPVGFKIPFFIFLAQMRSEPTRPHIPLFWGGCANTNILKKSHKVPRSGTCFERACVLLKPEKRGPRVFARGFRVLGYAEKPGALGGVGATASTSNLQMTTRSPPLFASELGPIARVGNAPPLSALAPSAGGMAFHLRTIKFWRIHPRRPKKMTRIPR